MARILTVDDQAHITTCLKMFLERKGHEVHSACNGAIALDRLRSEPFDVLVTDVDMPEMDGLTLISHEDATRQLRAIFVMTGRTDYKQLAALQEDPRVALAPKPLTPSTVVKQIDEALGKADESNAEESNADPALACASRTMA